MSLAGNLALILAFLVAIYSIAASLLDSRKNKYGFPMNARYGVFAVAGLVTLAVGLLLVSLLTHNFSLQYVADYSSRETPLIYLLSGLWAGNAGALLFWAWIVALCGIPLLAREKKVGKGLLPYALPVILFTELLFLVLLFLDNPFKTSAIVPADGAGLNPLLRNVGMIFHPPLLMAGLALFVVPFAFAIAALITKKVDGDWLNVSRRWTIAAWLLLGLGNILGAWWAYVELNWGGYWGWDPVENSGLMPWLLITAFLHSAMMQKQRGLFKTWTLLLIIFSFAATIFETFATRTDLSVLHGFGQTGASINIILIFLICMLLFSIGLVISQRKTLEEEPGDNAFISGDTTFFLNNLLLSGATLFTLFGTLFPFLSSVFTGNRIDFGAGSFDLLNVPLFLAILLLSGLCIHIGWKKPDLNGLGRKLLWPSLAASLALIILILTGVRKWNALIGLLILIFVLAATIGKWVSDVITRSQTRNESALKAFNTLFSNNRKRYGGYIVHIAMVVIAFGVLGSSAYATKITGVTLSQGASTTSNGYTLNLKSLTTSSTASAADLEISQNGKVVAEVFPKDVYYQNYGWVVDTSIRSNLFRDVWVSMQTVDPNTGTLLQTPIFTVQISPLIAWIWVGGVVLLIGGLVSFSGRSAQIENDETPTVIKKKR